MTKTQAILAAMLGCAYLFASTHVEGAFQTALAFVAGIHICAAFTIEE